MSNLGNFPASVVSNVRLASCGAIGYSQIVAIRIVQSKVGQSPAPSFDICLQLAPLRHDVVALRLEDVNFDDNLNTSWRLAECQVVRKSSLGYLRQDADVNTVPDYVSVFARSAVHLLPSDELES